MEVTIKDIERNLRTLPENLLNQVNDYVDFLKDVFSENIPEWQKEEVLKRKREMDNHPEIAISEQDMSLFLKELEG
ncbi:hypothetical protein [Leadbetterella sp. DM7]|uniref:hypothetical protein n=1 Tax=Leadbetterella sp. DM7 TaxID=3235085 RepID=UPI00349ED57D